MFFQNLVAPFLNKNNLYLVFFFTSLINGQPILQTLSECHATLFPPEVVSLPSKGNMYPVMLEKFISGIVFHPQESLTKYSIPECKDPCPLDQFVKLVNSLAVRDIASWCHACGNTQLSRCRVVASECPTVREPTVSGTGGFFLGAFVTLLMVIFVTALWYFCLSKRCLVAASGSRPRRGLADMENVPDSGVI